MGFSGILVFASCIFMKILGISVSSILTRPFPPPPVNLSWVRGGRHLSLPKESGSWTAQVLSGQGKVGPGWCKSHLACRRQLPAGQPWKGSSWPGKVTGPSRAVGLAGSSSLPHFLSPLWGPAPFPGLFFPPLSPYP